MMRLFIGIAIPDAPARSLLLLEGGIPGARWQSREQLHLTLRFIGEVDGRTVIDIDDALRALREPAFELEPFGVGVFSLKEPRQLWIGLRRNPALIHLHRKVDTTITRLGLRADGRKFSPHITLARLKSPPRDRLVQFLQTHALFSAQPFAVDRFCLYRSALTAKGSLYTVEQDYVLEG
jgi:2'-5' RNA ligase